MNPKIDAILDPGAPPTVRYTGPFPPPWSLRERAAGVAVLLMGVVVFGGGIGALYRIISLILEGALS